MFGKATFLFIAKCIPFSLNPFICKEIRAPASYHLLVVPLSASLNFNVKKMITAPVFNHSTPTLAQNCVLECHD